tara:strand:- start:96 stop:788 length:693 start_codon:yes stop_codon:yes gene_type:complete
MDNWNGGKKGLIWKKMDTKKIIIVGAGGQARNVALLIEQIGGWNILGFVDDDENKKGQIMRSYPILGNIKETLSSLEEVSVALAIGNSMVLKKIVEELKMMDNDISFPNLIHPSAILEEKEVEMGEGNIINAQVVFTNNIKIGNYNYFNRCSSVSHDVVMGSYDFIHAGVHLSGELNVGDQVWFGINSTIIEKLNIGNSALIGAGAVVLKDVEEKAVMVGNPAKLLRYKS